MSGFKKGDLILTSEPFVYVLNNTERGKRCDFCFQSNSALKRCSQCLFAHFCNKECQSKAWDFHKDECKCIKNAYPKEPTPSLRLLSLMIFKIKKYGYSEPWEYAGEYKRNIEILESHVQEIKQDLRTCQQVVAFIGTLKTYIGTRNIPPSSEFTEIFGKMVINVFSIWDAEMQSIGSGLYLGASIFNHSCEPNAEVVFQGTTLTVRAVCDMPDKNIKNVYISYIDQMQSTDERQKQFREQYYFVCQCCRCTSSYYDELLSKLVIDTNDAKGIAAHSRDEVQRIKNMKKQKEKPSLIWDASMEELSAVEGILGDMHINRIKLMEFGFDACIQLGRWSDALAMGFELVQPYKLFYGDYHPNYCILMLKIGKMQLLVNHLKEAQQTLEKAEEAIRVSHGTSHQLYVELKNQQDRCEKLLTQIDI